MEPMPSNTDDQDDVDDDQVTIDEDAAGAETHWSDPETTPDLSDTADTLVLVGCGDAKADEARPAKDLYTSNYFGLKRRYAEAYGDEWAILSAKYGLLDPEAEIDPYDVSVDDVDVDEWGVAVAGDLPDVRDTEVVVLAGPDYAEEVEGTLFLYGADVEVPTEGMKIGERMSWLSDHLDEDQKDVEDESRMDEFDDLLSQITIGTEATVEWSSPNANGLQSRRGKVLRVGEIDDDYAPTGTPWIEVEDPERDDRDLIIWPAWDEVRGTYDDNERALGDLQEFEIHNDSHDDQDDDVDVDHDGYPFACYDCANRFEEQPDDEICPSCGGPVVSVVPLYGLALDDGETCRWCGKPALWEAQQNVSDDVVLCAGHASGFRDSDLTMLVDVDRPEVEPDMAEGAATDGGDQGDDADADADEPVAEIVVDEPEVEPVAPAQLPKYLQEGVEKQSSDRLRQLAEYALHMAAWKDAEAQRQLEERAEADPDDAVPDEWDADAWEAAVDEARESGDVPAGKGTLTTKSIDDRDYFYLQWREGDSVKSQYVSPVVPADSDSDSSN